MLKLVPAFIEKRLVSSTGITTALENVPIKVLAFTFSITRTNLAINSLKSEANNAISISSQIHQGKVSKVVFVTKDISPILHTDDLHGTGI